MKIGARLYGSDKAEFVETAIRAEELGYDSLWRGDHIVLPAVLDNEGFPYAPTGDSAMETRAKVLDPLLVFAHLAAVTSRVRLATGIYILPLRHPLAVAKLLTTLDVLSDGRLTFGLGIGWLQVEFELMGFDYAERHGRTREAIEIMRAVWTKDEASFEGEYYRFPPVHFEPKPVQASPPIVVGAYSKRGMRLTAELADGWYGRQHTIDEAREIVRNLDELRRRHGAGRPPLEVTLRIDPEMNVDLLPAYEEAGVDRVVLETGSYSYGALATREQIERFADEAFDRFPQYASKED
jgi:probable F420-dependent oxidoreductase